MDDPIIGKDIGNYVILDVLGIGSLGKLYRATQKNLRREVAFKVVNPSRFYIDDEYLNQFSREARALAQLEHPNIVPIYDFGSFRNGENEEYFIVTRLMRGGTLQERHLEYEAKGKAFEFREVANVVRDIAGALDFAHSRNTLHRDVRSSNIHFDDFGSAFLFDFGIVQILDEEENPDKVANLGVPRFMCPEELSSPYQYLPASDQYLLALTAYQMITGKTPWFEAQTPLEVALWTVDGQVPRVSTLREDVPIALDYVFHRALSKDPSFRYPTVRAFAEAFEDAIRLAAKKLRVFISYSSRNRSEVRELAEHLSNLGHSVWWDHELRNTAGQNWWETILQNIRTADLFIFVLTPDSLASYPCQLEYRYAFSLNKRILPVKVAMFNIHSLPAPLAVLQFVDYTEDEREAILQASLDNLPPAQLMPEPLPPQPEVPVSELNKLAEQMETPDLSEDEQLLLIAKLETYLDEVRYAAPARELLLKMQSRMKLFAPADRKLRRLLST